jgi:hypothetical protein
MSESPRLLPFRGVEPPEFLDPDWQNALFVADTQEEIDAALAMKAKAVHASAQPLEFGDVAGHGFHGNQYTGGIGGDTTEGLGGKSVQQFLAANPRQPGEDIFVWQGRIVQGLPKDTANNIIYKTRERYAPVDYLRNGIDRWTDEHGLPRMADNVREIPCDMKEADQAARYFETSPDQSGDPRVAAAYEDFKAQSQAQWDYMTKPESEGGLGVKIEFTDQVDPYKTAEEQAADLRDNHHMFTQSGLGGAHEATMTQDEYDRFRAVHDVFGHAAIGGGFDRHGEYEAWLAHASMYTGGGRDAMSTEYHGVNSALWAGDKGSPGTGKSLLLPEDLSNPPWDRGGDSVQASAAISSSDEDEIIDALGLDANWATLYSKMPWHVQNGRVVSSAQSLEFGDSEGHSFRGNQWTRGIGGDGKVTVPKASGGPAPSIPRSGSTRGPGQTLRPVTQTATGFYMKTRGGSGPGSYVTLDIGSGVTKKPTKKQAQQMLATLADLQAMYGVTGSLQIVDEATMAQLTGISPATNVLACAGNGTIHVMEGSASVTGDTSNVVGLDHGEIYDVGTTRYTLTHEYGHLYDQAHPQQSGLKTAMFNTAMASPNHGGLSEYGTSNATEAYAEAFADHAFGGTQSSTTAYAKAFRWKK